MKHNIEHVWQEIETIKNNHLEHIKQDIDHIKEKVERVEKTIDKQDSKLDKMDERLWWVFTIVVGTVFLGAATVVANMLGFVK
jgi:predicted  nucleic acid-binding Zn-ribbon protein